MEALATSITRRVVIPNTGETQALGLNTEKSAEDFHKLVHKIKLFLGQVGHEIVQIYYFLGQLGVRI
jgi:hypothetical protein